MPKKERTKINLKSATFAGRKDIIKGEVVTKVTISAPFDRLVADSMKIKEAIFEANGVREGVRTIGLDYEVFGATVKFKVGAQQLTLEGKDKELKGGLEIRALKIENVAIRKEKNHETMNIRFEISLVEDDDLTLTQYIHGVKKAEMNVIITHADEDGEAQAMRDAKNLGLFGPKAEDDTADETDEAEAG